MTLISRDQNDGLDERAFGEWGVIQVRETHRVSRPNISPNRMRADRREDVLHIGRWQLERGTGQDIRVFGEDAIIEDRDDRAGTQPVYDPPRWASRREEACHKDIRIDHSSDHRRPRRSLRAVAISSSMFRMLILLVPAFRADSRTRARAKRLRESRTA